MSVIHITSANYESEVLHSDVPVMLDFWASWCGPCRMIAPVLEEIAAENPNIRVGKINVDEEPDLAARFGVASIPTIVVMKNGAPTAKSVGFVPKERLLALL